MILATELRVGNKFHGIAGVQTIDGIMEYTDKGKIEFQSEQHRLMYSHLITVKENGNQYKPCEMDGIPLTRELLLEKCGFLLNEEYASDYWETYDLGKFHIKYVKKEWNKLVPGNWYYYQNSSAPCNYLHQLQNLYFALTNQELSII